MENATLKRNIPHLNQVILALAPAFEARDDAPGTFDLLRHARAVRPILPVYDGASLHTIYRDPHVNHAFRAWHDDCHLREGGHDFSPAGEARACELQCRDILKFWPQAPAAWLKIIRAEVTGQVEYFERHGVFPVDQAAFINSILEQ